jgi:hypothetical protein
VSSPKTLVVPHRSRKESVLSRHDDSDNTFLKASFTNLNGVHKDDQVSEVFRNALKDFFMRHPELVSNPQKVEFLKYCYQHYVNFDPTYRNLSIQEKLEQANRLASDFMGTMFKA